MKLVENNLRDLFVIARIVINWKAWLENNYCVFLEKIHFVDELCRKVMERINLQAQVRCSI